jgi:hypothetical protein
MSSRSSTGFGGGRLGNRPQHAMIAMPHVPRWIGHVGIVPGLILCGAFLGGQLWLAVLLMIVGPALVLLGNRYERGLVGPKRE